MRKKKARQKSKKPTRKVWVQALAQLVVVLVAGLAAQHFGIEIGGQVRSLVEVLVASGISALLPFIPAWATPPSEKDGVQDFAGRSL